MRRNRHRLALLAAVAAIVLALAGAALAAVMSNSSASATGIKVTEREYKITLSKKTVGAGTVTFTVHNAGHVIHALAVSGGGLSGVKKLPAIAPGKTRTLTVKFTRGGTIQVWCPMPGHAALGMKTALRLTGGTASVPPPGVSTTPDTSTGGDAWG